MGFSRGRHSKEVAAWLSGTSKPAQSFGNLHLSGKEVYSYAMRIAYVFREYKLVLLSGDAVSFSKTTTTHLAQVSGGGHRAGFCVMQLNHGLSDSPSVTQHLKHLGKLSKTDVCEAVAFHRLLPYNSDKSSLLREYLKQDVTGRLVMYGLYDLAKEV